MKSLLMACAFALCVAGCREPSAKPKITRCADGLEVAVFHEKDSGIYAPPSKIEFRQQGKVVTLLWEDEYLLDEVVSPDQKWVFLQETIAGRFKFCPVNQIMACLEDARKFVHVIEDSGAGDRAGFRFLRWEAPHTALVDFIAGGESEAWRIDLHNRTLTRHNPKGAPMFKPVFVEGEK